jgi:Oxygenase domain of the 2OGFeDO superfamily
MRSILLECDFETVASKLAGQFPHRSHADLMLDADAQLVSSKGICAVFLCGVIPPELHRLAFWLWQPVDGLLSNRATAVGTASLPRSTNRNGRTSPRSGVNERVLEVLEGRQGILGYTGKPLRQTALTIEHSEMAEGNRRLIELVDRLYKKHAPHLYAKQAAALRSAPQVRFWETAFTTIYLAKNFRTAYHRDSGNLHGVFSALMPTGKFTGGELILPRWRIGIAFKPGDLLLFDPQQIHGNLPIQGERVSAAIYCAGRL